MSSYKNPTTRINTKLVTGLGTSPMSIELFHRGEQYEISANELPFLIGRDQGTCQLVIETNVVSRIHCTLELRDGQIGVLDQSTNGTAVKMGRTNSVMIKGKFYPLVGRGSIQLGADINLDDPDLILFKIISRENT